jgi:organic radical activating enzyme
LAASSILPLVAATGIHNAVITGGEPLLQQRELIPLVEGLSAAGKRIEVETNGTIAPVAEMVERVEQWNVSPKLENSANTPAARDVCSALRVFASLPKAHFKFVVVEPEDVREVEGVASRYGIARERILLMPEAADAHTLRERGGWLAELCATSGYRFGPRLHIGLWGNERGR